MDKDALFLNNKKVIVIGGAGLLGSIICEKLISSGAECIIADISIEKSREIASKIKSKGYPEPLIKQVSIIDKCSIDDLISFAKKSFGKIDVFINTSYPRNENYGKNIEEVEYTDFCENINMHLGGYFLVSQRILEYFKKQQFGNLINISSIYGVIAPKFDIYENTNMTMPVEYAVIKSGIIHLTKYMAKYYAGYNIRVNCISPGGIFDNQPEPFLCNYRKYCCNKGMLDREDIIGIVLFLVSDLSKYINGQNIIVDDGFTL